MTDQKPTKPYPDFPLFPHATKRWAKKIRGKMHYFGPWHDPQAAIRKYLDQRDDLQAGRIPRLTPADTSELTVKQLVNQFLAAKELKTKSNELSARMFQDYFAICTKIADHFGKDRVVSDLRASDFAELRASFADGVSVVTLANRVRLARVVFRFAYDADLIDRPIKMGPDFKEPSKKTLRADRQSKPPRLFESAQLAKLLAAAGPAMRAMILLGINCGYGNTDCAMLTTKELDLKRGWATFPRPKTAIERRCPLWPETVKALQEAIQKRPRARDAANDDRVFLTRCGVPFVRTGKRGTPIDSLSSEFVKLVKSLDLYRQNQTFYALRHTTETIGGAVKDQPALDLIMGHVSPGMSAVYREKIGDDRLQAIVCHVRAWLFKAVDKDVGK